MIIREEKKREFYTVTALVREAYINADRSTGREYKLVEALRESDAYIPKLSLVSVIDNAIAGYGMFLRGKVGDQDVLILGLLAVAQSMRGHGVGGALVLEGQRLARKMGYSYLFVYGSNVYYPRLGYDFAHNFGVEPPEGLDREHMMCIKLDAQAAPLEVGTLEYPELFKTLEMF